MPWVPKLILPQQTKQNNTAETIQIRIEIFSFQIVTCLTAEFMFVFLNFTVQVDCNFDRFLFCPCL